MYEVFRRSRTLRPFTLDVAAIDAISQKIAAQFPNGLALQLDMALENRDIDLDDFDELKDNPDLPATIRTFQLALWHDGERKRVEIKASKNADSQLTVNGPTEPWCAGMLEMISALLAQHRPWWWWLRNEFVGWGISLPLIWFNLDIIEKRPYSAAAWTAGAVLALLTAVLVSRDTLMPMGLLQIRRTASPLKKHATTITLLLALISAVASVVQAVQGYMKP